MFAALWLAGCPDVGDDPMDWDPGDDPVDSGGPAPGDAGDSGLLQDADGPPPLEAAVMLQNLRIVPDYVKIAEGGTVTWTNLDAVQHNIRSGTPEATTDLLASGLLDRGDTYTFTFTEPGQVLYYCGTHANVMVNAVVEVVAP
ncbi:MAG: hypothetical protein HYY06_30145 [Deltaproteobacteria bacterium]|nr:hypothetical protein [Deltaproteobacteria bacterium]